MANADELTHVGMEIVTQGTKLTGEVLLKILESITNLFEKNSENRDHIIKDNTKEGKQRIKDLVKKHKEGVMAFDDNVTKEQMNDYVKEFKRLGVDFSVVKNEEDSFSFFFSAKDVNVIEKALKNVVEKKSLRIEKELDSQLNGELLDRPLKMEFDSKEQQLDHIYKQLTPEEKELFKQMHSANIESLDNHFADKPSYVESNKYEDLSKSFSEESRSKVIKVYHDNIHTQIGEAPKGKINRDELRTVENNLEKAKQTERNQSENKKEKQVQPQKQQTQESKEEQVQQIYEKKEAEELLTSYFKELKQDDKYEFKRNHFDEKSNTITMNYDSKRDPGYSGKTLTLNLTTGKGEEIKNSTTESKGSWVPDDRKIKDFTIEQLRTMKKDNIKQYNPQQEQGTQNKVAKPQEYSLKAVREIDTKLKEQDNKNQDRKRTNELSR